MHPDILYEFPGITTETDYDGRDGAIQDTVDTPPLSLRDCVELLRESLKSNNKPRHHNIFPSSSPTTVYTYLLSMKPRTPTRTLPQWY